MNYADLIGRPFEYGARGPDKFDCYGLCLHLLKQEGKEAPDYTSPTQGMEIAALIATQLRVWQECEPKVGAVVVFRLRGSMHCGYCIEGEKFIHAWEHAGGVCVEPLSAWKHRIVGFYEYRTKTE